MQLAAMKNSFRISNPPPDEQNADAQSRETALQRRKERVSASFANAGGGVGASGRSNRTGGKYVRPSLEKVCADAANSTETVENMRYYCLMAIMDYDSIIA